MSKWNKFASFIIVLIIFAPILTTQIIFANNQQASISAINITAGPENSASVAVINDGNEFFKGLYQDNNWIYEKLPLPPGIMLGNGSFSNPYSAVDERNDMVVFLKQYGSSEAYLIHYFGLSVVKYSILNIENLNERLFYTDGNFYLAYHNKSSFRIDRILVDNMTLINVFESNEAISFTTGRSFLSDMSIYYNQVVLGLEYRDFSLVNNHSSAYFLLIFQGEDIVIADSGLFPPNTVKCVSVFEQTVLLWGDHGFFFEETPLGINSLSEYEYNLAITKERLDLILYSNKEFILLNEGVIQLWEIDNSYDFFNYVLGVENVIPLEVQSNVIVDNNGDLYFAYQNDNGQIIFAILPPEEFLYQVGGLITQTTVSTLTTSLPTSDIIIIPVIIGITFLTIVLLLKITTKSKKSKPPIPEVDQEHYYHQDQLGSQILIKNLCSNCNAKRENIDVFCAECGWKL